MATRAKKETAVQGITFLTSAKPKRELKTVSARLDKDLHDRFTKACAIAMQNNMHLSVTKVIEKAFELAVKDVEEKFNVSTAQTEIK